MWPWPRIMLSLLVARGVFKFDDRSTLVDCACFSVPMPSIISFSSRTSRTPELESHFAATERAAYGAEQEPTLLDETSARRQRSRIPSATEISIATVEIHNN